MEPERPITPSTLSIKDLPWQVIWDKEKCSLCGKCTAICPVNAIELGVFRKRLLEPPSDLEQAPAMAYKRPISSNFTLIRVASPADGADGAMWPAGSSIA